MPSYRKKYRQYAKDFGVSERTIKRWAAEGHPLDDPEEMRLRLGLKKHTPEALTGQAVLDRKERKLDLECQKLAFNLEVAKGQFTENAKIREDLTVIATAMRAACMRLENDLPGQLAGLDEAAIQLKIRAALDAVMQQLSQASDDLYRPTEVECPPLL